MIILNPTVGVAPGTTTIQLGGPREGFTCLGGDCPQNPVQTYTSPLEVVTELPSKAANPVPPGEYWDPYVEEHRFQGLDGAGPTIRWGLVLFAGVAVFAGAVVANRLRAR